MDGASDLPDDVDPELWFECVHHPDQRDYLLDEPWQTFPGRMAAWCAARQVSFRVSKAELPTDLPAATRYWVRGFLVGNVPLHPVTDDLEGPAALSWRAKADRFLAEGFWPGWSELQWQWFHDAQALTELGRSLIGQPVPQVRVQVPSDLADIAIAAWSRDDDGPDHDERPGDRVFRRRAGVLALIGLALDERGVRAEQSMTVDLDADLVVAALEAVDDAQDD